MFSFSLPELKALVGYLYGNVLSSAVICPHFQSNVSLKSVDKFLSISCNALSGMGKVCIRFLG